MARRVRKARAKKTPKTEFGHTAEFFTKQYKKYTKLYNQIMVDYRQRAKAAKSSGLDAPTKPFNQSKLDKEKFKQAYSLWKQEKEIKSLGGFVTSVIERQKYYQSKKTARALINALNVQNNLIANEIKASGQFAPLFDVPDIESIRKMSHEELLNKYGDLMSEDYRYQLKKFRSKGYTYSEAVKAAQSYISQSYWGS